jgi:crotonobetainyl-CoA:carnitine CoA-transferase CaiB-like acyl-CoA transferase
LAGVTIIELSTYYAAPYAATLLGELGARVIKLEDPAGDPHRFMLPFPELAAIKALFGKECVAVDVGKPQGREIAHRIIGKADMVLQSFRAGVAERLSLDPATLLKINPELIYVDAPGYGRDGPYGRRPAFAPTIGAAAGLAWRNVGATIPEDAGLPLERIKPHAMQLATSVMGAGHSDGLSAVTTASAMMLGLLARKRGAGGQEVFTTMLSSTAHALSEVMVEYAGRPDAPTAGTELYGFSALYRLYQAAGEDDWVFLAAPKQKEWDRLCGVLNDGARLAGHPRFATVQARQENDVALAQELAAMFRTRSGPEWEIALRTVDVACVVAAKGPVEANYHDEGSIGRQLDLVTTCHHPLFDELPRVKPLLQFSRSATTTGDAGLIGQHTEAVLREFGYSADEIAAMATEKIISLG